MPNRSCCSSCSTCVLLAEDAVFDHLELVLQGVGGVEVAVDQVVHQGGEQLARRGRGALVPLQQLEQRLRVPLATIGIVAAHGDEPLGSQIHVDLGERPGERDDVDVVLEPTHARARRAPVRLVEGAIGEAVFIRQHLELLDLRVDDVDPGHAGIAELVRRLHRR